MPSFCNIFTSQSTWVITVLCFSFGLATAPVLLTKWDGTVSSPNYPFTYPTNTTLTWIKTVSSGNRITITIDDFQVRNSENLSQPAPRRSKYRAIPHLFEDCFWFNSWENSRDCHITMSLFLETMEVQIKGDQWNKRFRTVQVYWKYSQLEKNHAWIGYPLSSPVGSWEWAIASNDDYVINGPPRSESTRKNRRSCYAGTHF